MSTRSGPAGIQRIRSSALWQLARLRTLGFLREPEAVFWVFVFPILLAAALGIAFRTQKPQPLPVAVAPGADSLQAVLAAVPDLRVVPMATDAEAERALRTGKIVALVRPPAAGSATSIAFDP